MAQLSSGGGSRRARQAAAAAAGEERPGAAHRAKRIAGSTSQVGWPPAGDERESDASIGRRQMRAVAGSASWLVVVRRVRSGSLGVGGEVGADVPNDTRTERSAGSTIRTRRSIASTTNDRTKALRPRRTAHEEEESGRRAPPPFESISLLISGSGSTGLHLPSRRPLLRSMRSRWSVRTSSYLFLFSSCLCSSSRTALRLATPEGGRHTSTQRNTHESNGSRTPSVPLDWTIIFCARRPTVTAAV